MRFKSNFMRFIKYFEILTHKNIGLYFLICFGLIKIKHNHDIGCDGREKVNNEYIGSENKFNWSNIREETKRFNRFLGNYSKYLNKVCFGL